MEKSRELEEIIKRGEQAGILKLENNRVTYPNGKSYDLNDPEEMVRARVIVELVTNYKYPAGCIDTDVYSPRRGPNLPADIVIFKEPSMKTAFIVVETRASSTRNDINTCRRKGLGNANLHNSKYLLIVCDTERVAYNFSTNPSDVDYLEEYRIADIPVKYGHEPKYRYYKGREGLEPRQASFSELDSKFQLCHDHIWEGGKRDPASAFDEISKLVMTKLYDERYTATNEPFKFQIGTFESPLDVAKRVKEVYQTVKDMNPNVFKTEIELPDDLIKVIVGHLQDISLSDTDLDAKGRAFENFLGKLFRDEYGQYFTPRQIVEFMVQILDPDEFDTIIDPSCGSGGFLLYSMTHVLNKIKRKYGEDHEKISRINWDFAHNQMFGIEINDRIARVAMMDMVIHEDGHSNIECADALADYSTFDKKNGIGPDLYQMVLTNPPFGQRINSEDKQYFPDYDLAKGENGKGKSSEMSEVLFLERCLDLAKKGTGKIGIVLPDSTLTNKGNIPVIEEILRRAKVLAIISLPKHTFLPYGATSKTSLLFLQKKERSENDHQEDYPIFLAHVEHVGYDATRRDDSDHLKKYVVTEWNSYQNDRENYPFKEFEGNLWTARILRSQLRNKLDVEAYGKDYIRTMEKIHELGNNGEYEVRTLQDLCRDNGIFAGIGPKKRDYTESGIPIIKTATIRKVSGKFGMVDWNSVEHLQDGKYSSSRKSLKRGDILIQSVAHTKEYIADKVAFIDDIPEGMEQVLALSKFIIIRPDPEKIDPGYLYLYLSSNMGRNQLKALIRGMTAEIYAFDLKDLLVAYPSDRVEQRKITQTFMDRMQKFLELNMELNEAKDSLDEIDKLL